MPERTNLHRFPVPSSIQKRKNVPPRIVQTLHAMERENQKLEELLDLARSMNKTTSKTHTKLMGGSRARTLPSVEGDIEQIMWRLPSEPTRPVPQASRPAFSSEWDIAPTRSSPQHNSRDLLNGTYDEQESAQSFQQALQEWRQGGKPAQNDLLTGSFDEQESAQSFQQAPQEWYQGGKPAQNDLLTGSYDEQESAQSFQQALQEWRQDGPSNDCKNEATVTHLVPKAQRRIEFQSSLSHFDRILLHHHRREQDQ